VTAVLTGVALAASAGLRAFLPLLAVGAAGRWAGFPVAASLAWLTSDTALWIFGVAALVELLADKLPPVDHALDLAQTVLSPVAGVLVLLGPAMALSPAFGVAFAIIAGAPIAGVVHAAAAAARVKSSLATGGTANPILSLLEDLTAVAAIVVGFLVPVLALAVVTWLVVRRRRVRPGPPAAAPS
jgi:hypothetical protein